MGSQRVLNCFKFQNHNHNFDLNRVNQISYYFIWSISNLSVQDKCNFALQLTANDDICNGSTDNHSQNESPNFQTFISEASIGHVGDFEHVESMLSTLIEDSQDDSQNIMPLSHELRQAITNMEDIEDVSFKTY